MLKSIEDLKIFDYNSIILDVNNFCVAENDNPYGHVREFNRLDKNTKIDAHRVISPFAIRLANIEDTYSATDINGNTYMFDIFEDGNYRISEVVGLKTDYKEDLDEKYNKKDN